MTETIVNLPENFCSEALRHIASILSGFFHALATLQPSTQASLRFSSDIHHF